MARKSENFVIKAGKMSPRTMDFGFRKERILPATLWTNNGSIFLEKVLRICSGWSGENSLLISLK